MRTWVKLHTRILQSPDLDSLSDHHYRHCIKLYALAGFVDDHGQLGTLSIIAYHLRAQQADALDSLTVLSQIGIAAERDGIWHLVNWDKYQSSYPSAENGAVKTRVQKHRENKAKKEKSNDVTQSLPLERNDTRTEENRKEEKRKEIPIGADAPKAALGGLSEAAKEYFAIFKRKRWANAEQQAEFEKAEGEVGAAVMLRAVKWAGGNNIVKVPAICTTARKMAKGGPALAPSAAGKNGDNGMKGWN